MQSSLVIKIPGFKQKVQDIVEDLTLNKEKRSAFLLDPQDFLKDYFNTVFQVKGISEKSSISPANKFIYTLISNTEFMTWTINYFEEMRVKQKNDPGYDIDVHLIYHDLAQAFAKYGNGELIEFNYLQLPETDERKVGHPGMGTGGGDSSWFFNYKFVCTVSHLVVFSEGVATYYGVALTAIAVAVVLVVPIIASAKGTGSRKDKELNYVRTYGGIAHETMRPWKFRMLFNDMVNSNILRIKYNGI